MAIDSRNKRGAALGRSLRWITIVPAPDGSILGNERAILLGLYPFGAVTVAAPRIVNITGSDNTISITGSDNTVSITGSEPDV